MSDFRVRSMESEDRTEVAELICVSINYWYQMHGRPAVFSGAPHANVTRLVPALRRRRDANPR